MKDQKTCRLLYCPSNLQTLCNRVEFDKYISSTIVYKYSMLYHMFRFKAIITMKFYQLDYPCSGVEIRITTCFKYWTIIRLSINTFIGNPIGQIFCSWLQRQSSYKRVTFALWIWNFANIGVHYKIVFFPMIWHM